MEYHTAWIQKYMYSGELHGMDLTIYVQWRITQHRFNNIRIVENYTSWIQQYNICTVENTQHGFNNICTVENYTA